jgi:hypothetical protein
MVDVMSVVMAMVVVGRRHGGIRTKEYRTKCDYDCRYLFHETNSLTGMGARIIAPLCGNCATASAVHG